MVFIGVAFVAISYIFGFVAHRIIQIAQVIIKGIKTGIAKRAEAGITKVIGCRIAYWNVASRQSIWPEELVARKTKKWRGIEEKYTDFLNRTPRHFVSSDLEKRMDEEIPIWALRPERLHHEIDFNSPRSRFSALFCYQAPYSL